MRWQRVARPAIVVVGLGVAVGLYWSTRERPVTYRPATVTMADPDATVQGSGGQQIRYRGEDKQFTLVYKSVRGMADGRNVLEGVTMTAEDGSIVTADFAETRGKLADEELPAEFVFRGRLRLKTPEATEVAAEEGTYEQITGRLALPGPVTFTRGRVSGSGVGGSYERDTGQFTLLAEARVTGGAADGQAAFTGSAETLTFNRASKALLFERAARVETASSTLTADRSTVYLTEDTEQFRVIELRNNARVEPQTGKADSMPDMRAVDMDLAFHEGGQALQRAILTRDAVMVVGEGASRQSITGASIVADTAPDGRTLTRLEARDRVSVRTPAGDGIPERTTSAAAMVATGDATGGLTNALFSGGVTFVEILPGAGGRAAAERRATGDSLSMALGGKLDQIDEARFERTVTFRDGDVTGDADVGVYRAARGQLLLQPATPSRRRPHVKSAQIDVEASERIDIDLGTRDLYAVGDVKTVSAGNAGVTGQNASLFDASVATHGFSREFRYLGNTKHATYLGTPTALAAVRQGDRSVAALSITIGADATDLTARGSVDSVLVLDQAAGSQPGAPSRRRITGDSLEYHQNTRTAVYIGLPKVPVVMTGPDGVTRARRLVLTLASASRTLERLEADTDVHLTLTAGREALADMLLYDVPTGRYTLRGLGGRAAVLKVPNDKSATCLVSQAREVRFSESAGMPEFPEDPGGTKQVTRPCAETLRR